ncbi:hypothetical protein THASP1DRAFT_32564 [Thamnocephalis sphaerospora]|uniref:F-box domain-containing protein n=1 Tax=Thamnocephalis sphaerospora TaxID=78915 RepID=A0A4P9XJP8_9FUNG|nr:hypothetical protein THASP1DRAFT_32564 [Thamnocephalis sphaerospora]|eukprot:RKP05601.1 hypothetical protein THASP1DRAFT_32564 [Thamnocephalis sphaerospora]
MPFAQLPVDIVLQLLRFLPPYPLRQLACAARTLHQAADREIRQRYESMSPTTIARLPLLPHECSEAAAGTSNTRLSWVHLRRSFWSLVRNVCHVCGDASVYLVPHPLEFYALCHPCQGRWEHRQTLMTVSEIDTAYGLVEDGLLRDLPSGWVRSCDLELVTQSRSHAATTRMCRRFIATVLASPLTENEATW